MNRYEAITPERAIAVLAMVEETERIELRHPETEMAAAFRAIAGKPAARVSVLAL